MPTDEIKRKVEWIIFKYADEAARLRADPYAVETIDGNLALTEGIVALAYLIAGIGSAANAYSNANAYIGVGDSDTAAAVAQTGLQAASNKAYAAMDATFPQYASAVITWQATFGAAVANYAWKEFTIINGADDTAVNLNRKVDSRGTKESPMEWTVQCKITLS